MSNKKQTAVEWLLNEFQEAHKDFGGLDLEWLKRFDQAKEMEKQQIVDAWYIGIEKEGEEHGHTFLWHRKDLAEQYYNETFKQL
jgi:hypothetical protein